MVSNNIIGYSISALGLIIIALSNQIAKLPLISTMSKAMIYITVLGVALVAVGLVLAIGKGSSKSKVKHASEEVPIYQGEGKNKRIIGYKRVE